MVFFSPIGLCVGIVLLIGLIVIGLIRRPAVPRASLVLIGLGALLLALAAGNPAASFPRTGNVVVMVDLTPSTRTASYRDNAMLQKRLSQLLGATVYRRMDFGDESTDHTTFTPPAGADAVVLLSDARFELPGHAPPTYVVADPNLEHPVDASVVGLESRAQVIATVHNSGPPRQLRMGTNPTTIPTGTQVVTDRADEQTASVSARFDPGDAWPENDQLTLTLPPPARWERWWVTSGAAPPSWRTMSPSDLPGDAGPYLSTAIIVLDNISADAISQQQQDRLQQFVRDLGGGVLILGGDHAFAAGGYDGSAIDAISPLASSPPTSQRQWIILVDSSGSMASPLADGAATRWQRAASAAADLLAHLPPNDIVSIGSFARDLRWWSQAKPASETAKVNLPPADIAPAGPTNLAPVLQSIASQLEATTPTQIFVISDADTSIEDVPALASKLATKNAKLNLLATADASRSPLTQLARLSGGQIATQLDPRLWNESATRLARAVKTDGIQRTPITVTFESADAPPGQRVVNLWNRTWLKRDATRIASGTFNDEAIPLAARWHVGSGQVAAAAFAANKDEAEAMGDLVARRPRDPRFDVSWKAGSQLVVTVDARDRDRYLNDLRLTLRLGESSRVLSQTAPGRYELSISAPRSSTLATLRQDDQVIDRFAVAGRYPPEFDAIGNDHAAMRELAHRTGGAVIESSQTRAIDFNWPRRQVPLTSLLACCAAGMIALGLVLGRLR